MFEQVNACLTVICCMAVPAMTLLTCTHAASCAAAYLAAPGSGLIQVEGAVLRHLGTKAPAVVVMVVVSNMQAAIILRCESRAWFSPMLLTSRHGSRHGSRHDIKHGMAWLQNSAVKRLRLETSPELLHLQQRERRVVKGLEPLLELSELLALPIQAGEPAVGRLWSLRTERNRPQVVATEATAAPLVSPSLTAWCYAVKQRRLAGWLGLAGQRRLAGLPHRGRCKLPAPGIVFALADRGDDG